MNYICKQVKALSLFKFRHHWFSAREFTNSWTGRTFSQWTHDLN